MTAVGKDLQSDTQVVYVYIYLKNSYVGIQALTLQSAVFRYKIAFCLKILSIYETWIVMTVYEREFL